MLKEDGNKNGIKINRLISKKKKNNKFARVARVFVFLCRCFSRLQCRFVRLKRKTSQLHIIFMEELSYVFTKDFVCCVHDRFYFFTAAHFHLAANISHFLTTAMEFSCFSSNEICLPSSFSVVQVSLNIKNNVKKTRLCCCLFFSL